MLKNCHLWDREHTPGADMTPMATRRQQGPSLIINEQTLSQQ